MAHTKSQKKQARLLALLLAAFALMLLYSFGGRLNIPTEATVRQMRRQLSAKREELQRVEEDVAKYRKELEAAQREYELMKYNANLERDAQAKFDRILDDANVAKTKSTVTPVQNRNKASLQQVNINVEFEDISMRKLADLFEAFGAKSLQGDAPLYWTKLTITSRQPSRRGPAMNRRMPGQPPQPQNAQADAQRQINVSAMVSAYSLYANASDLVFSEQKGLADTAKAGTKGASVKGASAKGASAKSGNTKTTRVRNTSSTKGGAK